MFISNAIRRLGPKGISRLYATIPKAILNDGKTIDDFLPRSGLSSIPKQNYSEELKKQLNGHSYVIETYGCQMNRADSEIMETILTDCGMHECKDEKEVEVIIMNTCSVREHAESRIWNRLTQFRHLDKKYKKHTILCISGCMASRLKDRLLESGVDVVVGPDSYNYLPNLIASAINGKQSFHTTLSKNDEYEAIDPLLLDPQPCTQLTIMRGCNNMCSYCVVPYTRGRERSVHRDTILHNIKRIKEAGYKEIMLLGQNVNSYCDVDSVENATIAYQTSPGFRSPTSIRSKQGLLFPELLEEVAETIPDIRIRFMSPHPKDFPLSVLEVIKKHPNICRSIHLPLQSGSDSCLKRMNRPYTHDAFVSLVHQIRDVLPDCAISTDVITGFCGETESEHQATLDIMREIGFDHAFMYLFSMRENTYAWNHYKDDVKLEIKKRRLTEIQDAFYSTLKNKLSSHIGKIELVLVEGESKRSKEGSIQYKGRCDSDLKPFYSSYEDYKLNKNSIQDVHVGDFIACRVITPGTGTHIVEPLYKTSIQEFTRISSFSKYNSLFKQTGYYSFLSSVGDSSSLHERSSPNVTP